MDFYNELMRHKDQGNMDKTASHKSSIDLRRDLEDAGTSAQEMQVLAASILGMMSKNAEEEIPAVEDMVEQPSAAPVVDPAVEAAAAVSADDQIKEDATDAAIASAKASINDAASAIGTLEAVTSDVPGIEGIPAEDPIAPDAIAPDVAVPDASAAMTSDDNQVVAADGDDGTEKKNEPEDDKEDEDEDDEDDDEDKEVEAAMQEYNLIMKEGTEEEKTALINETYDIALVKLARAGVTFEDFIFTKVGGDADLTDAIVGNSVKLAALSGQNYLKVADDIMYQMEKSASEL